MVKKAVIYVICIVLLGLGLTETVAYAAEKKEEKFVGHFVFEKENNICNLSGIKVDIFKAVIDDIDEEVGLTVYAHEYYSSVYTDEDGYFSFVKPTEQFVVIVDVLTLPEQFGINKVMSFYKNNETKDAIEMYEIAEIKVSYNEVCKDGLDIKLYSENLDEVFADYYVESKEDMLSYQSIIAETYNFTGNVICGDISKEFSFSLPYDVCTTVVSAVETEQISRENAIDMLTSKLEHMIQSSQEKDINEDCELLIKTIKSYLEEEGINSKSKVASGNSLVRSTVNRPTYTHDTIYPANYIASGIAIHYNNSNGYTTTPQYVLDAYNALLTAKNAFCGQMGFRAPVLVEMYLSATGTGQTTYIADDGSAFIELRGVSNLTATMNASKRASVTHEFFHCIQHEYKNLDYTPKWYVEAFAEWGKYMVHGSSALDADRVNDFLEKTYLPVDNLGASSGNYREYGRVLLPAFLTQYFGGYTKVRGILEYLSAHSPEESGANFLYDAITSVVQSSGYDFYSFFVEWAAANYTPKAKYYIASSEWNDAPFISNVHQPGSYTSHSGRCTLNYLAAHYQEFVLPESGSYTIDFTLSPYSTNVQMNGLAGRLILKYRNTGNSISYNMNENSSASFYTFSLHSNTNDYSRACIMPVNINTSGSFEYWYGATLQ